MKQKTILTSETPTFTFLQVLSCTVRDTVICRLSGWRAVVVWKCVTEIEDLKFLQLNLNSSLSLLSEAPITVVVPSALRIVTVSTLCSESVSAATAPAQYCSKSCCAQRRVNSLWAFLCQVFWQTVVGFHFWFFPVFSGWSAFLYSFSISLSVSSLW